MKPKVGDYIKRIHCGSLTIGPENEVVEDSLEYEYGIIVNIKKEVYNDIQVYIYKVNMFDDKLNIMSTKFIGPAEFELLSKDEFMVERL